MPRKDSSTRQAHRPLYPMYLTTAMIGSAVLFCERCETRIVDTLAGHLHLHDTLPAPVSSLLVTYT